jgi:uncharacterized protein (TIGR00255 family)
MTGFGRGASAPEGPRVVATAQGWNHRFADIQLRLPEELRGLEGDLRNRVAALVGRGRCEVVIRFEDPRAAAAPRAIDREALARFLADAGELVAEGRVAPGFTLGDLARSPFVVAAGAVAAAEEELAARARAALAEALDGFDAARAAEGARLADSLHRLLDALARLVDEIAVQRDGLAEKLRDALTRRLAAVLPGGSDALPPERLAQEVVLLVDRHDVHEELERLRGHIAGFREAMSGSGPHGRKLDFLVQEILRELNTLGSKSRDLGTTRSVVEAKVVNEQLRELVQNVE